MKVDFPKKVFVTGIGTDIGKTVVSAILCKAIDAEYWKPIQSGSLDATDSDFVSSFGTICYTEAYKLKTPASPHHAAALEGKTIELEKIIPPVTQKNLVIEGAGGLMVPLNETDLILDLIVSLEIPVILVSNNYLGSINHTLLTCEMLHAAGVEILGIIFNGVPTPSTEDFILNYTSLNCLGRVSTAQALNDSFILNQAEILRKGINEHFAL